VAEKDKKTFKEQLEDPYFEALGGFNIFSADAYGLTPSKTIEKLERVKKKIKAEQKIEELPKGSEGYKKAVVDKTLIESAEDNNEVSLGESVSNAIIAGLISIPYGWAQLTAEIKDAVGDDVPLEETNVAKLDTWFDKTVIGELYNYSEEKARATGAGRITEFLTSMYGNWKAAGKPLMKFIDDPLILKKKGKAIADKLIDAKKNGRYISSSNKNLKNAADKAKELNFGKRAKKWGAIAVGGGVTGALVANTEDIGTWGDWLFEPGHYSSLDRTQKETSSDDAIRKLTNRLKLGGEMAFPITPIFYGLGKFGKWAAKYGKDAAYSNKAAERWADKWIMKPFRARSDRPREIFRGVQRLEGKQSVARNMAQELNRRIGYDFNNIFQSTRKSAQAVDNPNLINDMLVNFMKSTDDVIKKGKIVFPGFKNEGAFAKSLTKLGAKQKDIDVLLANLTKYRDTMNIFKNSILQGKNLNVAPKEFNQIMSDRFKNFLSTEYKILTDQGIGPISGYKITNEMVDEVAETFMRYAKSNGVNLSKANARDAVYDIADNVSLNPLTRTPEFVYPIQSIGADKATQIKNIAENITSGGKFKADKKGGLIQTKSDLEAFKKLFGANQNAERIIVNTMEDLGGIAARDNFYNAMKIANDQLLKNGERGLFYPNRLLAISAFKGAKNQPGLKNINVSPNGLKLSANLAEEYYTSPLDGMFTNDVIEKAMKFGDKLPLSGITKSLAYRYLFLIPKGLTQFGKTVLGPFTHGRNFTSGAVTTIATGNIFIPPAEMAKAISQAFRSIQPQTMYRITGNPKWLNEPADQAWYRFFLDEGMVNTSATYREVMGIITDIQKGGDFFDRAFKMFGNKMKKISKTTEWAQDMYVAEDDIWKMTNFFGESYKLRRAWNNAIAKGIKNPATGKKYTNADMPSDIDMYKTAAQTVRNTLPNYAYVSDFVKGTRRSPLGNFVSWPAEIMRTTGHIMRKGLEEIKDPVLKRNGYERLVGLGTAYAVIPPMLVEGARGLYGITREQLQAMREMVAPWSVDSTLIPIRDEEGNYKYVDFSGAFFYDTVVNPVQSVISQSEIQNEKALIPDMMEGMVRGLDRLIEPFIGESIYYGLVADLFIRGGVDRDGNRVWNPEDDDIDKWIKGVTHFGYTASPLSYPQLKRLYAAATDQTIRGREYNIPEEMLGFFGARPVQIYPLDVLNFAVADFVEAERNQRKLITEDMFTGDPVTDRNFVIEQYWKANKKRLNSLSALRRKVDAAIVLGENPKKIYKQFYDRGKGSLYVQMMKNRFVPFSSDMKWAHEKAYEQAREKGLPNPLDGNAKILNVMEKILSKAQFLNNDYILNLEDFTTKVNKEMSKLPTPPLDTQPMPVVNMAQNTQQKDQTTNLTRTEEALLSPSEKIIAGRT
tara:strand:+ start:930 stop:5126 length:4197 start_codon:yes stop_codon:yes gene_type:complete